MTSHVNVNILPSSITTAEKTATHTFPHTVRIKASGLLSPSNIIRICHLFDDLFTISLKSSRKFLLAYFATNQTAAAI